MARRSFTPIARNGRSTVHRLRYVLLFVSLVVLVGVSAGALDVPHTFAPGDVISAAEVNQNFAEVEQVVTALEVTRPGIAVSPYPASYVQIPDVGVAITVASVTLDVPAAGYVLVSATYQVNTPHTAGTDTLVETLVTDDPAASVSGQPYARGVLWPRDAPSTSMAYYCVQASASRVFAVAGPGPVTYHLRAVRPSGGGSFTNVGYPTLTAVYLPVDYGAIAIAMAHDVAPSGDPYRAP